MSKWARVNQNAIETRKVNRWKIHQAKERKTGLTDRPTAEVNRVSRVCLYVSTVGVLNTAHPTATGDLGTTGNNHVAHPTL